jgi:hypothetical protein
VSSSERPKRPSPERTQPIRSWSTLFAVPTAGGDDADADPDASTAEPPGAGLNEVVSRSVDLGYRVIDEYIRQGQKAAQRFNDRSYGTQAVASDLQELGMRMTQYASDFAAVWLEFVQLAATKNGTAGPAAAGDAPIPPPEATATNPAAHAADGFPRTDPPPSEPIRVRIEVLATQPTEVSLDIRPSAAKLPLLVHALRAVDPDKPRLTEVTFDAGSDDEPPRLRIRVPAGQPAGVYSGLLIDEQTSRPAGTVSVRISEA